MFDKQNLFISIHALSPNEKVVFKKYISSNENTYAKNLIKLFDVINQIGNYTNAELNKQLHKHKLHLEAIFLFKKLENNFEKCFQIHQIENTIKGKLSSILANAQFLFDHGLNDACLDKIKQARKLIFEYELFDYYEQLYWLEAPLIPKNKNFQKAHQLLNHEYKSIKSQNDIIKQYFDLSNEIYLFYMNHHFGSPQEQDFNYFVKHDLLKSNYELVPLKAQYLFHYAKTFLFLFEQDWNKAYLETEHQLKLFLKNKKYIDANEFDYINCLGNMLLRMLNPKRYERFEEIKLLLEIALKKYKNNDLCEAKRNHIHLAEWHLSLEAYQFDRALKVMEEMNAQMENTYKRNNISNYISMVYQLAISYFYCDKFDDAQDTFNFILQHPEVEKNNVLYSYSTLMLMFIAIEKNNMSMVDKNIDNIKKMIYRYEHLQNAEKKYIQLIKIYALELDKTKRKKALEKIATEFDANEKILDYFNILWWIDAKLNGKTIHSNINKPK